MESPKGIILLGLRGSGKSTVGPLVAGARGVAFVDLDPVTLRHAGGSNVAEIVDARGWESFRACEREALGQVLEQPPCVLALGGGTPTDDGSRELLIAAASCGTHRLVYLRAKPETLAARMQTTGDRPSLTGADPFDEISVLFDARDPLYLELAHAVVETDGLSLDETVSRVADAV